MRLVVPVADVLPVIPGDLRRIVPEPIILNVDGLPIAYKDSPRTRKLRRPVLDISEAIESVEISLDGEGLERTGTVIRFPARPGKAQGAVANTAHTALCRVFSGDWQSGGRIYGHWAQGVPSAARKRMTIDGEPVAEPDYPAHHARILSAVEGIDVEGDPYDVDEFERNHGKLGFNTALNAKSERGAVQAIVNEAGLPYRPTADLLDALAKRHPRLARHFYTGAWRWLQRLDSEMALQVCRDLIKRGIAVVPIHDSFLVPERHESVTREAMDRAFSDVISRAA